MSGTLSAPGAGAVGSRRERTPRWAIRTQGKEIELHLEGTIAGEFIYVFVPIFCFGWVEVWGLVWLWWWGVVVGVGWVSKEIAFTAVPQQKY